MNSYSPQNLPVAPLPPLGPSRREIPSIKSSTGMGARPVVVARNSRLTAATNGKSISKAIGGFSSTASPRSGKPLTKRDLLMIMTRLSIMLRSGVDLADAVRSISIRGGNQPIERAMRSVYTSLESGASLSQAMDSERHCFGGIVVASAAAGEASGRLPEVLSRLIEILSNDMRLYSSIRSSVSYPIVLLVVTMLVMLSMLFFVLPQFAGIYESASVVIPPWTAIMLDFSLTARQYWWALLLGAVLVGFLIVRAMKTPSGRKTMDRLFLQAPILRSFTSPLITGRIFRLQGMLLVSGVSMLDVLHLTRQSTNNRLFVELCGQIESKVIQGESVASALRECSFVPEEASEMVASAEVSGQLGSVLQTLGEFYESQGAQKLQDAIKIAEPAIIVGMGIIIGAMVLSVMLPLLDLSAGSGI